MSNGSTDRRVTVRAFSEETRGSTLYLYFGPSFRAFSPSCPVCIFSQSKFTSKVEIEKFFKSLDMHLHELIHRLASTLLQSLFLADMEGRRYGTV